MSLIVALIRSNEGDFEVWFSLDASLSMKQNLCGVTLHTSLHPCLTFLLMLNFLFMLNCVG